MPLIIQYVSFEHAYSDEYEKFNNKHKHIRIEWIKVKYIRLGECDSHKHTSTSIKFVNII